MNDKITLGFNIYRTDFDPFFLIDLIKKYALSKKSIRLSTACPAIGCKNQYVPIDKQRLIAKKIVKFAKKCNESDISIGFDCGFVLCSFTEEECGKLHYYNAQLKTYCTAAIDVAPDLTVWRCFATSSLLNKKLTDFKSTKEIEQFYEEKFGMFRQIGAMKKCLTCKYLKRGQCPGGGLSQRLQSFHTLVHAKNSPFPCSQQIKNSNKTKKSVITFK